MNNHSNLQQSRILFWIISVTITIFSFQLIRLQLIDYEIYHKKSTNNSIKIIPIPASRGVLFDRNFKVVVGNKPVYQVTVIPAFFDTTNFQKIEKIVEIDSLAQLLVGKAKFTYSRYKPIILSKELEFEEVNRLIEYQNEIPGLNISIKFIRDYGYGVNGSHIFGYLNEISSAQLKINTNYEAGDEYGASGIEKSYEKYLHGQEGKKFAVVDSKQRFIKFLTENEFDVPAIKGNDLVLTIDKQSQIAAEKMMEGKKGSVVALNPKTGEIIALVSSPSFDLKSISALNKKEWREIVNHLEKPLFNRATMSIYPPGSSIKPIEALAAYNEGYITEDSRFNCSGGITYGNQFFGCDHIHGSVDLLRSIEKSCNTYYYEVFLKMGYPTWLKYFKMFGFGRKTNVDILEESSGILPDSNYYNRYLGKRKWNTGMLLSLSIGQGELAVTPIQMAQYVALIANNGKTIQPHFVKGIIDSKSNKYNELIFPEIKIDVDQQKLNVIKKGMELVVNGAGTATNIRSDLVKIAGKTGTAQNPHGKNHAIFVSFAPTENPEIVVVVLVENVGYGSTHAAPIAKKVIYTFLRLKE